MNFHPVEIGPQRLMRRSARQATVLYVTAEVIRNVAILTQPVMSGSAGKLLDLLAIPATERSFAALGGARRIAGADTGVSALRGQRRKRPDLMLQALMPPLLVDSQCQ